MPAALHAVTNRIAPAKLSRSVNASADISNWLALATKSFGSAVPYLNEYALWQFKWVNIYQIIRIRLFELTTAHFFHHVLIRRYLKFQLAQLQLARSRVRYHQVALGHR